MRLLAIDTSTEQVAVAIGSDGVVSAAIKLRGERRHAEQLVPAIRYVADETGTDLSHLAAIAVCIGPGLFTGLRVGVTTAKVMAQALHVPVIPVGSLDLAAFPLRHSPRLIVAALDARRGELFHASYRSLPGGVQRVTDDTVSSPEDLVADLVTRDEPVLLAGDGAIRYRELFAQLEHADHAGQAFVAPSIDALVELASARLEREDYIGPAELVPRYLRASDAELDHRERVVNVMNSAS